MMIITMVDSSDVVDFLQRMVRGTALVTALAIVAACASSPQRAEYISTKGAPSVSPEIEQKCREREAQVVGNPRGALAVYDASMTRAGYVPRELADKARTGGNR